MNKTAYLYGADNEVAQEIAVFLLKKGWTVATQFSNPERKEIFFSNLPNDLKNQCVSSLFTQEIGKETIKQHLDMVTRDLTSIDLYIHAEDWQDEMCLLKSGTENFAHTVEQRLRKLFFYCQILSQMMARKKKGQIIIPILSDVLYYNDFPSSPVYNQGVIAFVKSFAKELSPFGISINAFELGYYKDVQSSHQSREMRNRFALYALKPHVPKLNEAIQGLGMLLDYGHGMSGQTIQWGYGTPLTTI